MCDFLLSNDEHSFILSEEEQTKILNIAMTVQTPTESGIYYKYVYNTERYGSEKPSQRLFCRTMISLNRLYTKEEIDIMSFRGLNRSMGHNGQNYSLWKYRGSLNCRHCWLEVRVDIDPETGLPVETARKTISGGEVKDKLINTDPVPRYN